MTDLNGQRKGDPMNWLVRYARHCNVPMCPGQPDELRLRSLFGAPAWRVLCRTGRAAFVPILRNRDLTWDDLVSYCQRLAERSFVRAPRAELLAYFISQRRLYFSHRCGIPSGVDFDLMRIAAKERSACRSELALVANWLHDSTVFLVGTPTWKSLVRRAREARRLEYVASQRSTGAPWLFFCEDVAWQGYQIGPLRDSSALWLEGAAMGSCLFDLRFLCSGLRPSRFFSVRRSGKRVATLELSWQPPKSDAAGMDAVLGRWDLKDLRLSFNRLPEPALVGAMQDFAKTYQQWSVRSGRWPPGQVEESRTRIARLRCRSPAGFRISPGPALSAELAVPGAVAPDLPAAALPRPG